ncbi:pantoate--beta-alanine ligase [Arachidicoccus sp.]|uniref:pantoate--beta-alanine ligase n=1 Tax=Arachidicoccus sp. TaxID=1872624 RepID=UPI003D229AB4
MIVFKQIADLQKHLQSLKKENKRVGFVPTMGALHQGHLSLIKLAQSFSDIVVCSIFVNPTQFNDSKDFDQYPITIEQDILLLEKQNTNILFLPSISEIYPKEKQPLSTYHLGVIETVLEGSFRPGHFQGVCQVVDRLLEIVIPDNLFLGQKDYQQVMIIQKMIELKKHSTKIIIGETLREKTGLANSSRNLRLSENEKKNATAIYQSLLFIKENIDKKPILELQQEVSDRLLNSGFKHIDYIAIVNAKTLQSIATFNKEVPTIALIAAFMGEVRLIDNLIL